jgi:hypothetical protein
VSTPPKPATPRDVAPDPARLMLVQLHKADAAVRCFPEPREGPEFERVQRTWSGLYARAIAMGARFEAEDA